MGGFHVLNGPKQEFRTTVFIPSQPPRPLLHGSHLHELVTRGGGLFYGFFYGIQSENQWNELLEITCQTPSEAHCLICTYCCLQHPPPSRKKNIYNCRTAFVLCTNPQHNKRWINRHLLWELLSTKGNQGLKLISKSLVPGSSQESFTMEFTHLDLRDSWNQFGRS